MLRLGVIGTGMISSTFIAASGQRFETVAIMSRSTDSAESLARECGIPARAVTSIDELLALELDAVYIASPNSLHAAHALASIDAGIHVMVEKPAFWNPAQWEEVRRAADAAGVLVFEAARNMYEPGMVALMEATAQMEPSSASFTFAQYSSRWDAVLAGDVPNIFSLDFGGGALVDLGIYAIYTSVACFGEPQGVHYEAVLAPTGVDAHGTLVLSYQGFDVTIRAAKDYDATSPAEIYAGRERLVANGVHDIRRVEKLDADGAQVLYDSGATGSTDMPYLMSFEAAYFAELITAHNRSGLSEEQGARYAQLTETSRVVNEICTRARHSAGIYFTGEAH